MFRFKPTNTQSIFVELENFKSLFLLKVPSFCFGRNPPFARKTLMQEL